MQLPEELSPVDVVVLDDASSFLQACKTRGTEVAPTKKFLMNFFLDCSIIEIFGVEIIGFMS